MHCSPLFVTVYLQSSTKRIIRFRAATLPAIRVSSRLEQFKVKAGGNESNQQRGNRQKNN